MRNLVGLRAEPENARHGGDDGGNEKCRSDPRRNKQRAESDHPEQDGEEDAYTHATYFPCREHVQPNARR